LKDAVLAEIFFYVMLKLEVSVYYDYGLSDLAYTPYGVRPTYLMPSF